MIFLITRPRLSNRCDWVISMYNQTE